MPRCLVPGTPDCTIRGREPSVLVEAAVSSGLPSSTGRHPWAPERMECIVKEPRLFDEFEQIYQRWRRGEVTQVRAAALLGTSVRTFRRNVRRYEDAGPEGLVDGRASGRGDGATAEEVALLVTLYAERYGSWSVAAFHREYRAGHGGKRSYSWVRRHLQAAGLVRKRVRGTPQRMPQEQPPIEGLLLLQDAIRNEWVPKRTWDLVVTFDEATNRVYSGFFCGRTHRLGGLPRGSRRGAVPWAVYECWSDLGAGLPEQSSSDTVRQSDGRAWNRGRTGVSEMGAERPQPHSRGDAELPAIAAAAGGNWRTAAGEPLPEPVLAQIQRGIRGAGRG